MKTIFKSTYAQLSLMFGVLLLANFIIIVLAMRQITFTPAAKQMATQLSMQVDGLKPLLKDKNFQQAKQLLTQVFPSGDVIVEENPQAQEMPNLKFYQAFKHKLLSQHISHVKWLEGQINENSHSMLWIKPAWKQDYWVGITFQPFIKKVSHMFFLLLLGLILLSYLAAYFFSRYMLKPFRQLADMASDIVEDKESPSIKGTTEVEEISQIVRISAEKIQQLNKEKELLLAGVSHDLRTPLARMRLQAEFLSDNKTRGDFVQDIEEMDQIIADFVTYVRSGTIEEFQKVELSSFIQSSIEPFSQHGKPIEFNPATKPINLCVKPLSFKRMLNNIYENAFKYGAPPVVVSFTENQNSISVCIVDHGKGLCETLLTTIFQPFVMAQTKNNAYGSGLGLSIVQKLAEHNNAEVYAKNKTDAGLQVCIVFPLES